MSHVNTNHSNAEEEIATVPNSPRLETDCEVKESEEGTIVDAGFIGALYPLNRDAKDAFQNIVQRRNVEFYQHHCSFIPEGSDCFVFTLSNLPEFAPLGWRIGRGRKNLRNLGVDILLMINGKGNEDIAGIHARFAWVKGGGGFFLVADNMRGKTVTLNGELLSNEQRFIPYRNTIGIGECYFTLKFPTRTAEEDEQFQVELAAFYSHVLSDSAPLVVPTPCEQEVMMGDWVVRNAIAKGTFGHVYAVTHTKTGKAAAAKELWRTPRNSRQVDEEVAMAKRLLNTEHKNLATPFQIYHKAVHNKVERARLINLLDDTWKPGPNDVVDKYTFFSPLSTSTFYSLIDSKASKDTRTMLFTQVLEGLAFLHDQGITHRDIKPLNLTVQSYDPPLAQIIDFGCATARTRILYDWPGTIPYLAPEQRPNETHGRHVDYWASSLVGLQVLGYQLPNQQLNEKDFEKVHTWLGEKPTHPLEICCKSMLQWAPADRMTARSALEYPLAQYTEVVPEKRKLT